DGYEVVSVGRGTERATLSGEQLAPLIDNVSVVVFCAGGSSVGQSIDAPFVDFDNSVPPLAATLELLRTRAPSARLVFLSSAAVYGHADHFPTREDSPARPISPYGFHKRIGEQLCSSWAGSYGLQVAIVRLFSVYGPGLRKQLLWDACRKARAGQRRFAGTGGEIRDWLHIDDAVALIMAATRAAANDAPVINGGTSVPTTVASIVADVFAALDAGVPEFIGGGRPGDPPRYVADISRASALGWLPRVEVKRGVRDYVRWFVEQG
ncbi:MAG: putative nucleoside-diphosphate-sugar epimerase protein, partial [bacterium]|nr:putative nucleoside-diphosphate-sugar epimerase protein [bacterium]